MDIFGSDIYLLVEWTVGEHDFASFEYERLARLLTPELNDLAYVPTEVKTRRLAQGCCRLYQSVPLAIRPQIRCAGLKM